MLSARRAFLVAAAGDDHASARTAGRAGSPSCRCRWCRHGRAPMSPSLAKPRSNRFVQTVKKVSGSAAASTIESARGRAGTGRPARRNIRHSRRRRPGRRPAAPISSRGAPSPPRRSRPPLRARESTARPAAAGRGRGAGARRAGSRPRRRPGSAPRPRPGRGTGRSTGCRTSGPPASAGSIASHVVGEDRPRIAPLG